MAENYAYKAVRNKLADQAQIAKEKSGPLTADERTPVEEMLMEPKDHVTTLRHSIQTLIADATGVIEPHEVKELRELISPALVEQYEAIIQGFTAQASSEEGLKFIDIDSAANVQKVETWIASLKNELRTKKTNLTEADLQELEAQCWFLFEAVANVTNTTSLKADIAEFYAKNDETKLEKKEKEELRKKCTGELGKKYPFSEEELVDLIKVVQAEKEKAEYSLKVLIQTITKLWDQYHIGENKGAISKIAVGHLMAQTAGGFAPSLFADILKNGNFNLAVFLEYLGLTNIADLASLKMEAETRKVAYSVNQRVNERITDSLFYQEFEFMHQKSLGELYSTLERGKTSIEDLLTKLMSEFTPYMVGIAMSVAFMTKMNPILGSISLASLPLIYQTAKKQNEKMERIYANEASQSEQIDTAIAGVRSGIEEIRTSAHRPEASNQLKDSLKTKDKLTLERELKALSTRVQSFITFDISKAIVAITGSILQQFGRISGGEIFASIFYSERLQGPINYLVRMHFTEFARNIQDIQRMEEILGKYEDLDLPEGEKERERKEVQELPNYRISVKDLKYRDILKGVNLEIEPGEFVSIAGPSGAGKTTLLRILAGLYRPSSGEMTIGGVEAGQIKKYGPNSIYSVMSYSNQSPQIFEELTLRENLLLWSKQEIPDERIQTVLKELQLDKFADRLGEKVKNFSGGERVRIGLARTLLKGAKILLLDEPTSGLDSSSSTEVRKVIGEIHATHPEVTIVCVTHDQALIDSSPRSVNIQEIQQAA